MVAAEGVAATEEEVLDPQAAAAMEEVVVAGVVTVVAVADPARICGSGRGQARPAVFYLCSRG